MSKDIDMPVDVSTGEVKESEKTSVVSYTYDPEKDIRAVDPFGFINLHDAYENHNVPTQVSDEIANYNGIDDPDSMIGTPSDIFEAYRMNDHIQAVEKAVSSKVDEK